MKLPRTGYAGPTVAIIGAGATRGASFVPLSSQIFPPLDSDFFTQAQRLRGGEPSQLMQSLVGSAVRIFGRNFRLTMEGFLTQIEYLANIFDDYKQRGRPAKNPYKEVREEFLQVLATLLHESIGSAPACDYHASLINMLEGRDTILSFNYDCTIDHNLRLGGSRKWNARTGYGYPCYAKTATKWNPGTPAREDRTLLLLKLHGSLNWAPFGGESDGPDRLRLKERWWRQHGDARFEIVPPEWNKVQIRQGVYKEIWRKARHRVANCDCMMFVGYSLPATDLPAQALFRVDAWKAKSLKLLVIANPDREARRRIREVVRRRLNEETRVLTFDSFKEVCEFWG